MSKDMDLVAQAMGSLSNSIPGEDLPVIDWLFENSGLYVRSLFIDAGQLILGKEHNEWNVNILVEGSLIVMNDPYGEKVKITAPLVFETGPGDQKFAKALTDCVFMNIIKIKSGETKGDVVNRLTTLKEIQCQ